MAKQHLLLVDSDTKSLRILEVTLRKAGYQVTCALTGQDAVQILAGTLPDLIVSETRLPETDGYDLLRQLKANPAWQRIPFLFLSSETAVEAKMKGLELGADEFLTKPFVVQEVRARLQILLQKKERENFETTVEGHTHFSGRLTDMAVVDLIQTVEVSRKSGVIQVRSPQGKMAAIYFRGGKIIDATLGKMSGEQAVYRLLNWTDGAFDVEFKTLRRKDAIELSSQGLLMEGMRRVDEWARMAEQLPPLGGVYEVDYRELADRLAEIPDEINGILRLFDGRRSLLDVVDDSGFDDVEALNVLAKLYVEGLIYDVNAAANAGAAAMAPDLEQWLQDVTPEPAADDTLDDGDGAAAKSVEDASPFAVAVNESAAHNVSAKVPPVAEPEADEVTNMLAAAHTAAAISPVGMTHPAVAALPPPDENEEASAADLARLIDSEISNSSQSNVDDLQGGSDSTRLVNQLVSANQETKAAVPAALEKYDDGPTPTGVKPKPVDPALENNLSAASGGAAVTPEELAVTGMRPPITGTGSQPLVSPSGAQYTTNPDGTKKEMSRAEAEGWGDDAVPEQRISLDAVPMPEIIDVDHTRAGEPKGPPPGSHTQVFDDEFPESRKGRYLLIGLGVMLLGFGGYEIKQYRAKHAATTVAVSEKNEGDKAPDDKAPPTEKAAVVAGAKAVAVISDTGKAKVKAKAETKKAETKIEAAKVDVAKAAPPANDGPVDPAALASARAMYKKGQLKKAIPMLEKLTQAEPANDQALVLLANCYLDKGSASHALETAQKAISANSQNADGYLVIGAVQQQEGRLSEAKSAYQSYVKLAPKGQYAGEIRSILSTMQ